MLTRRSLLWNGLGALTVYALLHETRLLATPVRSRDVIAWLKLQEEIAAALAAGRITPPQWQSELERLAQRIDLDALRDTIDHAEQRQIGRASPNDPFKRSIAFRDEQGQRRNLHYGAALFAFDRDNVITPHAHRHMTSAHLVIGGALRVRNYDRLRDEENALVLRPSGDRIARVGDISTMSSMRDNVHWFVPVGAAALSFDVVVSDLDAGQPSYQIQAVDPLRAQALGDGSLRVPLIGFEEASRIYTREV